MKNTTQFLAKGATVFFSKGTDNSGIARSNVGKMAMALSLAGSVALMTPSTAEARGRGGGLAAGLALGLIGGMIVSRAAPVYAAPAPNYGYAQPSYGYQQPVVVPVPVQPQPYGYGQGGYGSGYQNGQPGVYYCPNGPQQRCYWRHGALEIIDDGAKKTAEAEIEAPSFKMG